MELLEGSGKTEISLDVWQTTCGERPGDVADHRVSNPAKERIEIRGYASRLISGEQLGLQSKGYVMDFILEKLDAELSGSAKRKEISRRVLDDFAKSDKTAIATACLHPVEDIVQCQSITLRDVDARGVQHVCATNCPARTLLLHRGGEVCEHGQSVWATEVLVRSIAIVIVIDGGLRSCYESIIRSAFQWGTVIMALTFASQKEQHMEWS